MRKVIYIFIAFCFNSNTSQGQNTISLRISPETPGSGPAGTYIAGDLIEVMAIFEGGCSQSLGNITFDFSELGGGSSIPGRTACGSDDDVTSIASYRIDLGNIQKSVRISVNSLFRMTPLTQVIDIDVDNTLFPENSIIAQGIELIPKEGIFGDLYFLGDTIEIQWRAFDFNRMIRNVTFDFSELGGDRSVNATFVSSPIADSTHGIYTASYIIDSTSIHTAGTGGFRFIDARPSIKVTYFDDGSIISATGRGTRSMRISIDTIRPTVSSLRRLNERIIGTSETVKYSLTFDMPVKNVETSDFILTGVAADSSSIGNVGRVSDVMYNVEVTSGTNNGILGIDFSPSVDITPRFRANTNNVAPLLTNNIENIDDSSYLVIGNPFVRSIRAVSNNPSSGGEVQFEVTFSDGVSNVDTSDFTLNVTGTLTGASISSVSSNFEGNIHTVGINSVTGNGTLALGFSNDLNIERNGDPPDPLDTTPYIQGTRDIYTFTSRPFVRSISISSFSSVDASMVTNVDSLDFLVEFSENVINVDTSDFIPNLTGMGEGVSITSISGSENLYFVTVNTGMFEGTLGLGFSSSVDITDESGSDTLNATLFEDPNTFFFKIDTRSPTVTSATFYDVDRNGIVEILLEFSEDIAEDSILHDDFMIGGNQGRFDVLTTNFPANNGVDSTLTDNFITLQNTGISLTTLQPMSYTAGSLTDELGNALATTDITTIDRAAPYVIIDPIGTITDPTPDFSGRIDDPTATLILSVAGQTRTTPNVQNNGDGTWEYMRSVDPNPLKISDLGSNEVTVTGVDENGNTGSVSSDFTFEGGAAITPAMPSPFCLDRSFAPLGQITIGETATNDFREGTNETLLLTLPVGFEFNPDVPIDFSISSSNLFSDIDIMSGVYVGTATIQITLTVSSISALEMVRIDGLQVQATQTNRRGDLQRTGGTAELFTANTNYATLSSKNVNGGINIRNTESDSLIDYLRLSNRYIFELEYDTFRFIVTPGTEISQVRWENIATGSSFTQQSTATVNQQDFIDNLDLDIATAGIYKYKLVGLDSTACMPETEFLIGVFDAENFGGNYTTIDAQQTIRMGVPLGYTPSFSGPGLGLLTWSPGNTHCTIPFTPIAAGVGTNRITYRLDDGVGTVFEDEAIFEVTETTDNIFSNVLSSEYCVGDMITLNADTSNIGSNFFVGFSCSNCPDTVTIQKPDPFDSSTTSHATANDWIFNTSMLSEGTYIINRFIKNGSNEFILGQAEITVNPIPTVRLIPFSAELITDICVNDAVNPLVQRSIDRGLPENVPQYMIRRLESVMDTLSNINYNTIQSASISLSNPLGDDTDPLGYYEIKYRYEPAMGDAYTCPSDADRTRIIRIIKEPSKPILSNNLTRISSSNFDSIDYFPLKGDGARMGNGITDEYVLEFCAGETLPNLEVSLNDTSDMVRWYSDPSKRTLLSSERIFRWEETSIGQNIFDNARTITLYFEIIDGTTSAACASDLRRVYIQIHNQNSSPRLTIPSNSSNISVINNNTNYFFEYCTTPMVEPSSYDTIVFNTTLPNERSYFKIYDNNMDSIKTIYFRDSLTGFDPRTFLEFNFAGADNRIVPIATKKEYTFYISRVIADSRVILDTFRDSDSTASLSTVFAGCESSLTQVNYVIYTEPATPDSSDFDQENFFNLDNDNSYDYFMCVGDITPSFEIPNVPIESNNLNYTYSWSYDSAGVNRPFEVANSFGTIVTESDLMGRNGFDPNIFDPDTVGDYTFYVALTTNNNEDSGYPGCTSMRRKIILHVYPYVDAPSVTLPDIGGMNSIMRDGDEDESTVDVRINYCEGVLSDTTVFRATTSYTRTNTGTNTSYFRWFRYDTLDASTNEITEPAGADTITAAQLGLTNLRTLPATRYYLVREITDVVDEGDNVLFNDANNAFVGCESTGTLIAVTINPLPSFMFTQLVESYCTSEGNDALALSTEDGNLIASADLSYTISSSSSSEATDTVVSMGTGQPILNLQDLHELVGGNSPNAMGNIIGGISTSHTISVTYTDAMTLCSNNITETFTIYPQPAIDFSIASNTTDNQEFCYDFGNIDLSIEEGNGLSSNGLGIFYVNGEIIVTNNNRSTISAAILHGSNPFVAPSSHTIEFYYIDRNGCENSISKTILINPRPQIKESDEGREIRQVSACSSSGFNLFVELGDSRTTLDKNNYSFKWFENGNEIVREDSKNLGMNGGNTLIYISDDANAINFQVMVINNMTGCMVMSQSERIILEPEPIPTLTWVGVTAGRGTGTDLLIGEDNPEVDLSNLTKVTLKIMSNSDTILFDTVSRTGELPIQYNFSGFDTPGTYDVSLRMETQTNCPKEIMRQITIIEHKTIPNGNIANIYLEDFTDSLSTGWTIEKRSLDSKTDDLITSWRIGKSPSALGDTENGIVYTDNYEPSEVSFIYSPSFDLSGFTAPAVIFRRFEKFQWVRDGVAFQYSTDDGRTWETIGAFDASEPNPALASTPGWYNNAGINSAPGTVAPGDVATATNPRGYGWAGNSGWQQARALIPTTAESVRFRFALASLANIKNPENIGFAFDDFEIYERNKNILVEQFSSVLVDNSIQVNNMINNHVLYNEDKVIRINYFTNFGNDGNNRDALNLRNATATGARSAFYEVQNVPSVSIDGINNLITDLENDFPSITAQLNNALTFKPRFNISIDPTISDENILTVSADFIVLEQIINQKIGLFIAIVEPEISIEQGNTIGGYQSGDKITNVLREMLPDPSGQFVQRDTINQGDTLKIAAISWGISNLYTKDTLELVAFIQNLTSLEIYQATKIGLAITNEELVLGIKEQNEFFIYPNPSDQELTIELPAPTKEETSWTMYNQVGKEVMKGSLSKGTQTKTIQTTDILPGLYFIQLYAEKRKKQIKKIIVFHE